MKVRAKFGSGYRWVEVPHRECPTLECFHPHDCPVQGYGGVRESQPRWMCLTNVLHGCPENPQPKHMRSTQEGKTEMRMITDEEPSIHVDATPERRDI